MYSEIKTLSEHIKRLQEFCQNLFLEDNSIQDLTEENLSFGIEKRYNYNEIIKNNELPKFIRKNLKYLFKLKIESDINLLKQKEYYNFEDEDSIELFSSLNTFFLERSFLKSTQLQNIITKIINLHFNFLLRPRFTLLSILNNKEDLEIKTINNKLANFFEYDKLIEEIKLELLNISFDSDSISKTQFQNLINDIDNKLILEMNAKDFLDLVLPIFEVFNITDENTEESLVPTEALMLFFDDKNLTPIVELLENKYNYDKLIYIDKTTLLSLLIEIVDSISITDDLNIIEMIDSEDGIINQDINEVSEVIEEYNFDLDDEIDLDNLQNTVSEVDYDHEGKGYNDNLEISNEYLKENIDIEENLTNNEIEVVNFDNLEDLLNLENKDYNINDSINDNLDLGIDGIYNLEDLDKII